MVSFLSSFSKFPTFNFLFSFPYNWLIYFGQHSKLSLHKIQTLSNNYLLQNTCLKHKPQNLTLYKKNSESEILFEKHAYSISSFTWDNLIERSISLLG